MPIIRSASQPPQAAALLVALALAGLACSAEPAAGPPPPAGEPGASETQLETTTLQHGAFQIPMPDWPELEISDGSTLRAVQSPQGWAMSVARHDAAPRLIARHLHTVLPQHGD